jgi:hypothetical protein
VDRIDHAGFHAAIEQRLGCRVADRVLTITEQAVDIDARNGEGRNWRSFFVIVMASSVSRDHFTAPAISPRM